ncbi:MAG: septum formation initiator family protein [Deltaproteobacteria bacterium]|nr:septum formation initiator family protein [Deltaproteobacteria bacterium]
MRKAEVKPFLEQGRRKGRILLALFAAWIVWISGVFGNSGVLQAYRLSNARYELGQRIKALESEKSVLESALSGLERDPLAQERAIRETLGFVRENELVFEFR